MAGSPNSERTAGGPLGRIAGRFKQAVGAALGRDDLDREGRLQQVQVDAERDAEQREHRAAEKEERAELTARAAETESERRRVEAEVAEIEAEERREAKRREAGRRENVADAIDPDEET